MTGQPDETLTVDLENWRSLASTLPAEWEQTAADAGLGPSQRDPHNASKVQTATRVHTLLTMVSLNLSLRSTSALFAAAGIHCVTHVGIHGWLKQSVAAFQCLLRAMVLSGAVFASERWAGFVVRAIDASTAQRPGAKGTTARIHLALRLSDMRVEQVKVTSVRTGETFRNFKTQRGNLDIGDRGYCNPPSIAAAVEQEGHVLVRWNFGSLPLRTHDCARAIDVRRVTRGLGVGERRELRVAIYRPGETTITGRLLIERLPAAEAELARQRAREEKAGVLAVEMAMFIMLFSTVPEDRLSACQLFELYRLRWQVELQFKREKSVSGLDLLPNYREDTIEAWLLAKLLLGQMARGLFDRACRPTTATGERSLESGAQLPISMPWYSAVAGSVLTRNGLLSFKFKYLDLIIARLAAQLTRLRTRGKKAQRQVADLVASLTPMPRAGSA